MTQRLRLALRPFLVAACFVCATVLNAATPITILHVGDSHSHLDAFGPKDAGLNGTVGGLAKAAGVIATIRASEPNTLLLHAGDAFHGDLFFNAYFGVPELQLLNELGIDAMAVGNHEFDFGPDVLAMALSNTGAFPLVSANVDISGYPTLGQWIRPSLIKEVEGVSVGILGLTIPGDPLAMPAPAVIEPDILPIAAQATAAVRAAGAQVVVVVAHLGLPYAQALAANVPGIDVIVSGHDHLETTQPIHVDNPDGRTTFIVAAGEFYRRVGRLRLSVDNGTVQLVDYDLIAIDESVPPCANVQAVVDGLKAGIVAKYGDVYSTAVGQATRDVSDEFNPAGSKRDTGMGNLITDALRYRTRATISLAVSGLISEGLFAGPIVGADVFRTVSYGYDPATGLGFKIATFAIQGSELLEGMEACLSALGLTNAYDLQVSGMRFWYDSRNPVGQRVLRHTVRIHGQPLRLHQTYRVAVNAGIAMLLPSMGVKVSNLKIWPDLEYNVLRDFIARLGTVSYGSCGRIRDAAGIAHPSKP